MILMKKFIVSLQDMNGSYNGNGDTDTVINHIEPGPGMIRKDNSPIFSRSNIGNRGTGF